MGLTPTEVSTFCNQAGEGWTFTLRKGAMYHDGSEFTAEAVVWNLDKLLKKEAPNYDPKQAAQGRSRIPAIRAAEPLSEFT